MEVPLVNYSWLLIGLISILLAAGVPGESQEAAGDSLMRRTAHEMGLQGRVLWMDATANIDTLKTRQGVRDIVAKCKKANINTIVLDVKPLIGEVMFKSTVAPKLVEWKGKPYPKDYDLLQTMLEEAHAAGIPVYASLNVFSEGHRMFKRGPAFSHPEWQSVVYTADRFALTESGQSFPVAANPNEAPTAKAISVWTKPVEAGKAGEIAVVLADGKVASVTEGEQVPAVPPAAIVLRGVGESRDWLLANAPIGAAIRLEARPVFTPIAESSTESWAVFVNPANSQARAYELSLIRELFERYDIDGVALDRMRYANLYTDFSETSRRKFERWLGRPVENWPQDIFSINPVPGGDVIPGKLYKDWLEWRAFNIQQFLADVEAARRAARPQAKVAAYVGSWYWSYYNEGVNWARQGYNAGAEWMTPTYPTTGYADYLDFLMVGSYYKYATREEAQKAGASPGATVQAATEGAVRVVDDATWVYGGLYLLDYKGSPEAFERAVRAAIDAGEGVMLFDLVYLNEYNWWPVLEKLFPTPATAPHDVPGLRMKLRAEKGLPERPF